MKWFLGLLLVWPLVAFSTSVSPIMVDEFKVKDVTFEEAIEALRIKAKQLDTTEPDPAKKGVNIILKGLSDAQKGKKVTLELRSVPMAYVLDNLCKMAGLKMQVESFAVVVMPQDAADTTLHTRTYRVPPDFLNSGSKK